MLLVSTVILPAQAQEDDGQWTPSLPGGAAGWSYTDLFNDGTGYVYTGEGPLYTTEDFGESWLPVPGPDISLGIESMSFSKSDSGFTTVSPRVFRTRDGAETWSVATDLPLPGYGSPPVLDNLEALPGTDDVMVTGWHHPNPEGGQGCSATRPDHFV